MNTEELFAGIGVIIDDKVFSHDGQDDRILKIVRELEEVKKFPLLKYADIPDDAVLQKLSNISFLLVDWEIDPRGDLGEEGINVQMGEELKASNQESVIGLVKKTLANSLIPVFIFSNQSIEEIKQSLVQYGVDLDKSQVFIKSKSELVDDGALFREIGKWVDGVSGVYVAKSWDNALNKAKNQFFAEMANNTSHWPKSLFNAAAEDSTNPAEEITQAISQNVMSRMQPIDISQEQIEKDTKTPTREEILGIMRGQFFLEKGSEASMVGDFYKKSSGNFYMNIRPTCDCLERNENDGYIYLLKCSKLSGGKAASLFNQGHFNETSGCSIVGPLYNGEIYRIDYKNIDKVKASEWKDMKVGRVLPPIIDHIAERYGLYVQRQALPRIPSEIILVPQINEMAVAEFSNKETTKQKEMKECWLKPFLKTKRKG